MKIHFRIAAAVAALLITSNSFPVQASGSDGLPEEMGALQDTSPICGSALPGESDTVSSGDPGTFSTETPEQETSSPEKEENGMTVPYEAPSFSARIEFFHGQGYQVRGTFTEFLPDTSLVQPLYSLDGAVWQVGRLTWDLGHLDDTTPEGRNALQNQHCFLGNEEPLSSYLAGELDRFYLKLQITLRNGITYESRTAVIERGDPQPIQDGYTPDADFAGAIRIRQWWPPKHYGQFQITVSADATPEEIYSLLPETLPVEVDLYEKIDFVTGADVDCPVTWKSLSLPPLTPGESIVIEDAAEEILVPAGTLLNTPTGIFLLDEPLGFEHDEVKLILNVVEKNAAPTGTLKDSFAGLEVSFDLKPTGVTAIRAYTLAEGEAAWTEIPAPLLPEQVNAPSSTASSLFTFVLTAEQEPYHSWLAAWNAGNEPMPFLVGLKIEGGVYDGQQLILAHPDTYKIPPQPPAITGSGGNEGNAGSDNKGDSTPEGQRPDLPQDADNGQDTGNSPDPDDGQDTGNPPQNLDDQNTRKTDPPQMSNGGQNTQKPKPSEMLNGGSDAPDPKLTRILVEKPKENQAGQFRPLKDMTDAWNTGGYEPIPYLVAEAVISPSASMTNVGTDSTAWQKSTHRTERRILLATTATTAIGVCVTAAAKATAGNIAIRFSEKVLRMLHKLLHLK